MFIFNFLLSGDVTTLVHNIEGTIPRHGSIIVLAGTYITFTEVVYKYTYKELMPYDS